MYNLQTENKMDVQSLEKHWSSTSEFSSDGYEKIWANRRAALASFIVEKKPKKVLEIGTFGGYNLREIHKLDDTIELVGFDINLSALDYAKKKCPAIDTIHGSIHKLEKYFTENQFDLIFTAGVLIHIPNESVNSIISNIIQFSKTDVVHAEHHGATPNKLPGKKMRWVHNFEALYETHDTNIFPAWDASNGFEHIVNVGLNNINNNKEKN